MYEITFIAREEKDDVVKPTIEELGGKIVSENFLGRKKFVYPIKKEDAGFYTTYVFELDPQKVNKLNDVLRLKNQILRCLIISKKIIIPKPAKEKTKVVKDETPEIKKTDTAVAEEKVEEPIVKKEPKKSAEKVKKQAGKKTVKAAPEVTEKPEETEKEKSPEAPKEKKIKEEKKPEAPEKEAVPDEKERLKALEDKLEEILKD